MAGDVNLWKVWEDQKDFNKNFFPPADTEEEKFRQTKEFVLCMMSELDELLNATRWKVHRKKDWKTNPQQIRDELTDLFKYLISAMQVWEVSPSDAVEGYWRKSMVCRQRFSEEFVMSLETPMVVCDIDGVLADYYAGFLDWVWWQFPDLRTRISPLKYDRRWLDHTTLGLDAARWQEIKHQFRVSGGKRNLPLFPGAKEFLYRVRKAGLNIVLLTSRPIDVYPNIYTDTLEWLRGHKLPFDCIWWSKDKGEKILEKGIQPMIRFAVDDDVKYACQLAKLGIKTYVVNGFGGVDLGSGPVFQINSLDQINVEEINATV